MTSTDDRHENADTRLVQVERSDVIDAAAALLAMATMARRDAERRTNGGPRLAEYRAGLRRAASIYEAASARMQAVADASLRQAEPPVNPAHHDHDARPSSRVVELVDAAFGMVPPPSDSYRGPDLTGERAIRNARAAFRERVELEREDQDVDARREWRAEA